VAGARVPGTGPSAEELGGRWSKGFLTHYTNIYSHTTRETPLGYAFRRKNNSRLMRLTALISSDCNDIRPSERGLRVLFVGLPFYCTLSLVLRNENRASAQEIEAIHH